MVPEFARPAAGPGRIVTPIPITLICQKYCEDCNLQIGSELTGCALKETPSITQAADCDDPAEHGPKLGPSRNNHDDGKPRLRARVSRRTVRLYRVRPAGSATL